ncbi:hypothetical protein BDQ12DRAFT_672022 [Crucibulum laeve]|uniref:Uncharacterized protein n=1 Tax=Crucibulum laeve TaxID=68775 RepID=A0A5C3LER0_9AGAR|nr:hypothetical protein BDQ12DRAFT_672022 [Crucibulum laeve]
MHFKCIASLRDSLTFLSIEVLYGCAGHKKIESSRSDHCPVDSIIIRKKIGNVTSEDRKTIEIIEALQKRLNGCINQWQFPSDFHYGDNEGTIRRGANVRQKAIFIIYLLQNEPVLCGVCHEHAPAQNHVTHGSGKDINFKTDQFVEVDGSRTSEPYFFPPKKPEDADGTPETSIDEIKVLNV